MSSQYQSVSLKRASTEDGTVSPPAIKRKQQSTTTNKTVATFFTPVSQKEPDKVSWRIVQDTLLAGRYQGGSTTHKDIDVKRTSQRIAAFDFDSTLITSASGLRFARDATDWRWWHSTVPSTLRKLNDDGYCIVILSNQGGISLKSESKSIKSDLKRLGDFKGKVRAVLSQLDLPISIYAATARDKFRKPRTGMWDELIQDLVPGGRDSIDLEGSFFIGDAGGRAGSASGGGSKDHSCSDRDFAANVGINFRTPEEFFLDEEPKSFTRDFDPAKFVAMFTTTTTSTNTAPPVYARENPLDLVLLCGSPGAGKSTFYWSHLKPLGYERVNQDILKTRDRCLKKASEYLEAGVPVVVDNTNADPDTRAYWVNLARRHEAPIRCVHFTASPKLCEHNDAVRALNSTMNPEKRTMLPKVAFTGFASRYREPTLKEGFQDITNVDFTFEGTEEQRAIWSQFWV